MQEHTFEFANASPSKDLVGNSRQIFKHFITLCFITIE